MSDSESAPDATAKQPVLALIDAGYETVPLNGKAPAEKAWLSKPAMNGDEAVARLASGRNVGVRLRPCDLVLDVDPRNGGNDDELRRFESDLEIDLSEFPHVVTGSGGHHFYMTVPEDFLAVGKVPGYAGLDLKAYGGQVVAPGSAHPETGEPYRWAEGTAEPWEQPRAPQALLDLIERPKRVATSEPGKYDAEQLAEMLEALYPEDFRDQAAWLELMMSCHYVTGGAGRDEFVRWSVGDPEYANHADLIGRRWDSLDPSRRDGVTERLLEKLWRESPVLRGPEQAALDFADAPVESGAVEAAEAIQRGRADRQRELVAGWVYLVRQETYLRRSDCSQWSEKQFRTMHQSAWKLSESIHEAVVKDKLAIRKVEEPVYEPGLPEFLPDGGYNIWRDTSVAAARDDALAQAFLDHLEYLLPDEDERGYLLDYLSFLAAEQPVKVHFAPLIYGPRQGTGKSFVAEAMKRMLGRQNVGYAESDDLKREYTAWAENCQLGVIEELMDVGRLEIANRLKTTITNPDLRIRHMYRPAYWVRNRLNLIAFTNHEDALRLENGDRRWLVLHSPAEPRGDDYYKRLFALLEDDAFAAAVRWMLQQRKPALNPKGQAPMTRAKAEMRAAGQGDVEQYLAELLETRQAPFDFDLVRLEDVWGHARAAFGAERNLRKRVTGWMKDAGAVQHPPYAKDDRPRFRLWSVRDHERHSEAGPSGRIEAWLGHTQHIG